MDHKMGRAMAIPGARWCLSGRRWCGSRLLGHAHQGPRVRHHPDHDRDDVPSDGSVSELSHERSVAASGAGELVGRKGGCARKFHVGDGFMPFALRRSAPKHRCCPVIEFRELARLAGSAGTAVVNAVGAIRQIVQSAAPLSFDRSRQR